MTAEQQKQWVREQYQVATKYLATQGLVTDSVVEENRIWYLLCQYGNSKYLIVFSRQVLEDTF